MEKIAEGWNVDEGDPNKKGRIPAKPLLKPEKKKT